MPNRYRFLILLTCVLASCTPKKKATTGIEQRTLEEITNRLDINSFSADWFATKVKIKAENNGKNLIPVPVNAQIRMKKDSVIWASVSPAIGIKIEVGRVLITPDEIQVLDRINKRYYKKDFAFIQNYVDYPLDFKSLQELIWGNFQTADCNGFEQKPEHLTLICDNMVLALNPSDFSLQQINISEPLHNVSLLAKHDTYQRTDGGLFAEDRTILFKAANSYNFDLKFSKVEVNKPQKFKFKVSNKYERMD